VGWHVEIKAPNSPQYVDRVAAGKTFEKEAVVPNADGQARVTVVMRRAKAHALPAGPVPFEAPDDIAPDGFEFEIN